MAPSFGRSLVAFMAHPDDAELTAAGTLKLLRDKGWAIAICSVTAGGMGGMGAGEAVTAAERIVEARASAALLGADFFCLGGRDGFLYDTAELRLQAIELIRGRGAGVVLAHLPADYHADHRAASAIAEAAALLSTLPNVPSASPALARTPALYHVAPLGMTDPLGNPVPPPGFFVDMGGAAGLKEDMLSCHKSQAEVMRVMHGMDDFLGAMRAQDEGWGAMVGLGRAEPFWQHLGGGFPKDPVLQEELAAFAVLR